MYRATAALESLGRVISIREGRVHGKEMPPNGSIFLSAERTLRPILETLTGAQFDVVQVAYGSEMPTISDGVDTLAQIGGDASNLSRVFTGAFGGADSAFLERFKSEHCLTGTEAKHGGANPVIEVVAGLEPGGENRRHSRLSVLIKSKPDEQRMVNAFGGTSPIPEGALGYFTNVRLPGIVIQERIDELVSMIARIPRDNNQAVRMGVFNFRDHKVSFALSCMGNVEASVWINGKIEKVDISSETGLRKIAEMMNTVYSKISDFDPNDILLNLSMSFTASA